MKNTLNKFVVPCVLASLLGGCVSFQSKPLLPAQTASAFESRSLDSAGLRDFVRQNLPQEAAPWPPKSWDLTHLTLVAFYFHPDLDVARAKWGVAEAGTITAGARPNPTVDVLGQRSAPGGGHPWTLGFNLSIPIETAGKRGYRIDQAQHVSEAARWGLAGSAWQVYSRVRASLVGLYAAHERVAPLKEQEALLSEIAGLLDRRLRAGEVSVADVAQARITLQQTRLALSEAQKQETEARIKLAAAIGVPAASLADIEISFDGLGSLSGPDQLPVPEVRREALLNRADILASLAQYDASQSALQLEIARQYPDIRLGPGYKWDQGVNKWSLGLSLALPLLNRNEGPIAEAEARRTQAAADFTALQAKVISDLDLSLAAFRAVSQKLLTADQLVTEQERRQASLEARFRAGETDRLALAEGAFELLSAKRARLDTLIQGQQSLGALEDAIQRPLAPNPSFPAISAASPRKEETQQ